MAGAGPSGAGCGNQATEIKSSHRNEKGGPKARRFAEIFLKVQSSLKLSVSARAERGSTRAFKGYFLPFFAFLAFLAFFAFFAFLAIASSFGLME